MKNYQIAFDDEKRLLSLTGLTKAEFAALLPYFERRYESLNEHRTMEGKPRQRQVRTVRKNGLFSGTSDMLFFVLYHLKINSLREQTALQFGMHQEQVSRSLTRLLPLLEAALKDAGCQPERHPGRIGYHLKEETVVYIDVTERPIQRNGDYTVQKEEYSEKKNALREEFGDWQRWAGCCIGVKHMPARFMTKRWRTNRIFDLQKR